MENATPVQDSPATSPEVSANAVPEAAALTAKDVKQQTEALLAEARNTKAMIEGFIGAVRGGRFDGGCMYDLAKGLSFLDAILNQNKAHIQSLQERLQRSAGETK